jgi:hypothetical protein
MKILVACEESQAVTIELRNLGHDAYSCDIQRCSGGHPEWHINGDVLKLLDGYCTYDLENGDSKILHSKWDMIIAFPPCTHLAVSGAAHFEKKRLDGRQREGIEFFMNFLNADCDKIVVENPIGIISGKYIGKHFPDLQEKYDFPIKSTQIIQPWQFGDKFQKSTCLWIKGLPALVETNVVSKGEFKEWIDPKTGKTKRQAMWFFEPLQNAKTADERSRLRSKTFPGIAKAMAEQWTR